MAVATAVRRRLGAWRRASVQMNSEMPPSTTSAPIAIPIAVPLLRPPPLVDVVVIAVVGVAVCVVVCGVGRLRLKGFVLVLPG